MSARYYPDKCKSDLKIRFKAIIAAQKSKEAIAYAVEQDIKSTVESVTVP